MDYEAQGLEFLAKTETKMETKFLGNLPFFPEDTESRDVYQITFSRHGKLWSFRFGQSIAESGLLRPKFSRPKTVWESQQYVGQRTGKNYFMRQAPESERIHPTAYDVLACLTKDFPGSFSDFCGDYGFDTNSKKAEKMYLAVMEEFSNCQRMFGDCLDQLREIQ